MRYPEATYRRIPAFHETTSPTCRDLLETAFAFLLGKARRLKEDWWLGRASAAFLAYYVCMAGPWFAGESVTFFAAYDSDAMGVSRSLTAAFMFLCFILPMLAGHSMIAWRHGCKAGILEALSCSAVSVYAAVGVLSVPEVLLHGTPWVGVCLSAILLVVAYFVLKKGGAYAAKLQLASGACRALVVLGVASAFLPAAGGLAERQIDYPDNMQDAFLEANIEAIARFYDDSAWSAMTPHEREDALAVLLVEESARLGLESVPSLRITTKLAPDTLGAYSAKKDMVLVNAAYLGSQQEFSGIASVNVICHETFHAYEWYCLSEGKRPEGSLSPFNVTEDTLQRYRVEFAGYGEYNERLIEQHAFDYGDARTRTISKAVSRHCGTEDPFDITRFLNRQEAGAGR